MSQLGVVPRVEEKREKKKEQGTFEAEDDKGPLVGTDRSVENAREGTRNTGQIRDAVVRESPFGRLALDALFALAQLVLGAGHLEVVLRRPLGVGLRRSVGNVGSFVDESITALVDEGGPTWPRRCGRAGRKRSFRCRSRRHAGVSGVLTPTTAELLRG